ncbi:MAG: RHS repeat protein, partial [Armatimonadetes bacterium]|nr:RHS repeat protein [Armatimonadota bacterium]
MRPPTARSTRPGPHLLRLLPWLLLAHLFGPAALAGSWSGPVYSSSGTYSQQLVNGGVNGGSWDPAGDGYSVGPQDSLSVSASGTVTATLTWQPAAGQSLQTDPPPATVPVLESAAASAGASYTGTGAAPCAASDGMGPPASAVNGASASDANVVLLDGTSGRVVVQDTLSAATPADPPGYGPGGQGPYYYAGTAGLSFTAGVPTGPDVALTGGGCTVAAGQGAAASVAVAAVNGFTGTVTFSFSNCPGGLGVGPTPPYGFSLYLSNSGTDTETLPLTVTAAHFMPAGGYGVTVTATGTYAGPGPYHGLTVTRTASLTITVTAAPAPPPPYAGPASPDDRAGPDPVDLANGDDTFPQSPDLVVYNPDGPAAAFTRAAHSNLALNNYGSPGLSPGWTHNYDYAIYRLAPAGRWGPLLLVYPNGAAEKLTPVLDANGNPTGALTAPPGAPYAVTGSASGAGLWNSFTLTFTDGAQWQFTYLTSGLYSSDSYAPTRITNALGQALTLSWGANRLLLSVTDAASGQGLLQLGYGNGDVLTALLDVSNDRQVTYATGTDAGTGLSVLTSVSQVAAVDASGVPARASYAYVARPRPGLDGPALLPLLAQVTVPSPTGGGASTDTVAYDAGGRVTSFTDAGGNQRVYSAGGGGTQVQAEDPAGDVALSWTVNYDGLGRLTGTTDAAGHSTRVAYGDAGNPYRPTRVTDRNGNATAFTYDPYGHVRTMTDPRGVVTAYAWDYSQFGLGRLAGVQVGSRTPTTFTYYEPAGLVQTVTAAAPGSAPGGATVTTSCTYDGLGDVLSVTGPGNGAAAGRTVTYNYTDDPGDPAHGVPGYSRNAASAGEPLTVTDELGHVTHLRYNARGLVQTAYDALGNETDTAYNLADQPLSVTLPPTGQQGDGRAVRALSYLYPGGPLTGEALTDEAGNLVRQVAYARGPEGETLSVSGGAEPATYTYDALYRVTALSDGNGHATHYFYNTVGELSQVAYPLSGATDAPLSAGSPDTLTYTSFDNDGHVLTRVDGDGTTTTYAYAEPAAPGLLLSGVHYAPGPGVSPLADTSYSYDAYGRLTGVADATGSRAYAWDDADDPLSVTTTYSGLPSATLAYAYNPDGSRQAMSLTGLSGPFSYAYDAAGRLTGLSNPSSEATAWAYYDNGWLASQALADGVSTAYAYDAQGRLSDLLNRAGGGATLSEFAVPAQGGYDGAGGRAQINAAVPAAPAYAGSVLWRYDARGQLSEEYSTRPGLPYDNVYHYDGAGNNTSLGFALNADNQISGPGFAYDGDGNPAAYNGSGLSFDPEGRLTAYGGALSCGWRADGMRAWKQNAQGARTYYLYDGSLPVAETDAAGNVTAVNTFGANGLVSRRSGGASVFSAFDPQGCPAERLDGSGAVLSHSMFAAYGYRQST